MFHTGDPLHVIRLNLKHARARVKEVHGWRAKREIRNIIKELEASEKNG